MVLAGLAMLIPSSSNQSHRTGFVDVVYSGLLVGFAVGCKVPFVPVAAIVFIWLLLAQRNVISGRTRVLCAGVFVLSVLATGVFWYVRNIVLTGNPLFPAEFGPFAGPFTAECMHRTKLISWILKAPTDFQQWRYIIQSYINWPIALFFLAAIGYLSGFYFLRRGNSSTDRRCTSVHLLLLATGLSLIVIYPFMPFSGTNNDPAGPLRTELRFVITPFIIGILVFSQILQDKRRGWLWFLVSAAAVLIPFGGRLSQSYLLNIIALAVGVCVLYIWKRFSDFFIRINFSSKTFLLLFLTVSIGIVICLGHQQNLVNRRIFTYGSKTQPVGAAWQELEKLPRGAAITVFGPTAYQYYPLFGRNMQFKPCRVDAEGLPFQILHQQWRENPLGVSWWSTKRAAKPNLDKLLDNLINTGVDYVLDTKWHEDRWVSQHFVLSASDKVERIYDDGYSVIWKIRR
jgi:hypothetical protein